ncbi:MAG TPA: PAS domain S-box protein, partial [Segetibacter sp.]
MGILKGPNHVYESANPLFLLLIDRTTDIFGKTVAEVLPEMVEQGFVENLNEVYRTGITFSANEIMVKFDRNRDGNLVDNYLNLIHQAYKNNDGVVEGIFIFAVDVTEQVLSRRRIEESEKRFRQIVETAQEGIWMIDENNMTTFVNDKMCEILEYTGAEMMGTSNLSFQDEEEQKKSMEQIERRKKGMTETYESRYITKSGKQIWVNVSTNPVLGSKGEYKGALAMITDITTRKAVEKKLARSETSLKKAQALADIGNWEIDLTDSTQLWSDELYKILGLNKKDVTPSTELYFSLLHPDDLQHVKEKILQSSKSLTGTAFGYRLIKKDDSIKYCYTESRFEFDHNNKAVRLYGVVQDITKSKLAEMERTKMIAEIIQRNKELEQFTYIVSHNLRAPVANIKSFAEALADKTYPESLQQEFLSYLSLSVSKLDDVTRDLNNVLLVKQKVNDVKELTSLSTIVDNIKVSIHNLIEQYDVTIETDFAEIETVLSIKTFLHSILYNLI